LVEDKLKAGTYGCTTEIKNCEEYHFKWDLERFKVDRKWFKTIKKCNKCDANNVLAKDNMSCIKKDNLANCKNADTVDNCAVCEKDYYLTTSAGKKVCKK